MDSHLPSFRRAIHGFPATRWTLVRQAGDEEGLAALEQICLDYWFPLYAWARHSGWKDEDAEDLIQSFFEEIIQKGLLGSADPERGRLRTYLLTCLKRHAGDLLDKARAAKRDARKTVSLDFEWAEGRYHEHQSDSDSPDKLYDRRWAHTLLHYALETLREEMSRSGRSAEYGVLKQFLGFTADESSSYQQAAAKLGIQEAAVKSRIFRLRKRFNEIVKEQAANTVSGGVCAKDELMALIGVV